MQHRQIQERWWRLEGVSGHTTITARARPTFWAYKDGQTISWIQIGNNTGATTININALGAKNVTKQGTTALAADDLVDGREYVAIYDGTRFQLISPITATGDGGGERDWATFDEDGAVVVQNTRDSLSCTKLSTGTYEVTRNSAFPAGPAAAPLVTPRSIATVATSVSVDDQLWFTTANPVPNESCVGYDPVLNNVWATDFDHDDAVYTSPDRIAIGHPTSLLPEFYWSLPSGYPWLFNFKGSTLVLDLTYRIAFVQAHSADGSKDTTLFVDMDTFAVLDNTVVTAGGSQTVLVGHSDDHLLIYKAGTGILLYSRDTDGTMNASLGTYSGAGGTGNIGVQHAVVDNNGHFWCVNTAAPKEWERYDTAASFPQAASRQAIPGSIPVTGDGLFDFRASENAIYFLTGESAPNLMKISCNSPYTYTTITGSPYSSSYDVNTADETLKDIVFLRWSLDNAQLIGVRGGNTFPYFFFVDPADGSIDVALTLPILRSSNYEVRDVGMFGDYIVTIGKQYLQVINYVIAGEGSALTFTPPLVGARMSSTTKAIVEFWNPEALPNKVKMDCGFHIDFARD